MDLDCYLKDDKKGLTLQNEKTQVFTTWV